MVYNSLGSLPGLLSDLNSSYHGPGPGRTHDSGSSSRSLRHQSPSDGNWAARLAFPFLSGLAIYTSSIAPRSRGSAYPVRVVARGVRTPRAELAPDDRAVVRYMAWGSGSTGNQQVDAPVSVRRRLRGYRHVLEHLRLLRTQTRAKSDDVAWFGLVTMDIYVSHEIFTGLGWWPATPVWLAVLISFAAGVVGSLALSLLIRQSRFAAGILLGNRSLPRTLFPPIAREGWRGPGMGPP